MCGVWAAWLISVIAGSNRKLHEGKDAILFVMQVCRIAEKELRPRGQSPDPDSPVFLGNVGGRRRHGATTRHASLFGDEKSRHFFPRGCGSPRAPFSARIAEEGRPNDLGSAGAVGTGGRKSLAPVRMSVRSSKLRMASIRLRGGETRRRGRRRAAVCRPDSEARRERSRDYRNSGSVR